MSFEVGKNVAGKVVSIMPFGAFVSLPEGKTGLVHISEIALDYVQDIKDHLTEGQAVKVKVVDVDAKGKISLSIKKVLLEERKNKRNASKGTQKGPVRPADVDFITQSSGDSSLSFEDKLSKFKSESDEKMQAIRRSNDSRRSGGYKRSSGNY